MLCNYKLKNMNKELLYVIKSICLIILFCFGLFLFLSFIASCKKITPGNYTQNQPKAVDTTTWEWKYVNKGTLPNWNNSNPNDLIGTKWVLTKVIINFATTTPNDTIEFVTINQYRCNNSAYRTYTLTSGVASTNKTLTLNYFYPFGGSHYSGEVGQFFVTDSIINNAEFKNIQNTTSLIKAWFKRIK